MTGDSGDFLREARKHLKEGAPDLARAALRTGLRSGCADPLALAAAGRLVRKLDDGVAPAVRALLVGEATLGSVADCVVGCAHGDDVRVAASEGSFDNVMQDLVSEATAALRPTAVVFVPWNERLLQGSRPAAERIDDAVGFWQQAWGLARATWGARIVQVGFDWMHPGAGGYFLAGQADGDLAVVRAANERLRAALPEGAYFVDLPAVSGELGRRTFYEPRRWFWSRQPWSEAGAARLAAHVWAGLRATHLGGRKGLILDLDNTLWGGVVGETGPHGVELGESPEGHAFVAVQQYAKDLRGRGVVLGVASKNNPADAREPFVENREMVLRLEDIAVFEASWEPKAEALTRIGMRLNLGVDSFVFLDDSRFEREHVRAALPRVTVPEVPDDPSEVVRHLVNGLWFETTSLTAEDAARATQYAAEGQRTAHQAAFTTMGDYLTSLRMRGQVAPIDAADLLRVAQLVAKTNQFNLTTRRHSEAELTRLLELPRSIGLTLRLTDRFGDYGLIAVAVAVPDPTDPAQLVVDTLLMSCRAIGRTVEEHFWARLVDRAIALDYRTISAEYVPTAKNALVRGLYDRLGLDTAGEDGNGAVRYQKDLAAIALPWTAVEP